MIGSLFKGIQANERVSYNLLHFTDEIILVGEGSWTSLWAVKSILRGFEMISRLRINMWKRKIYDIVIRDQFLQSTSYFLSHLINHSLKTFLSKR